MTRKDMPKFTAKEWNAGGAFHFYGSEAPRTYIVEVHMSEPIQGDLLQKAMDRTVERMPYYKSTFVRKKGLYYYADNDLPLLAAESEKPRTIGGALTNYHMIDVTYTGNRISFAMFHGLCDGLGLNRFIETTLYYYCCLKDGKTYSSEGIYTLDTPYDPSETADAFAEKTNVDTKELKKLANSEKRFRLPELTEGKGPLIYRLPLKIRTQDFLSWCKENGTSPAAAISVMVAKAVEKENHVAEGVIMAVLPFSLRKYLHADKTYKNTDAAIFLPVHPAECNTLSTGELAAKLRTDMKKQMNEEMALLLSSSINMIVHLGKKIPTYFLKNKIMAMKENRPQDTFFIDYVGSLRTNDYSDQITEVRYLNPDPSHGAMFVVMSETAGYFHINFNQTFASDSYYKGFLGILDDCGIPYETLEKDTYLNPQVELPKEQK
jgi:hypothetical protein